MLNRTTLEIIEDRIEEITIIFLKNIQDISIFINYLDGLLIFNSTLIQKIFRNSEIISIIEDNLMNEINILALQKTNENFSYSEHTIATKNGTEFNTENILNDIESLIDDFLYDIEDEFEAIFEKSSLDKENQDRIKKLLCKLSSFTDYVDIDEIYDSLDELIKFDRVYDESYDSIHHKNPSKSKAIIERIFEDYDYD
jgi:hypothetical protein